MFSDLMEEIHVIAGNTLSSRGLVIHVPLHSFCLRLETVLIRSSKIELLGASSNEPLQIASTERT